MLPHQVMQQCSPVEFAFNARVLEIGSKADLKAKQSLNQG
jgi:hypothetical protein